MVSSLRSGYTAGIWIIKHISGVLPCAAGDLCRLVISSTQGVDPSAAGMCVGDPWGGHCQGAHMGPVFGAGKQLSSNSLCRGKQQLGVGRSSAEPC